MISDVKSLSSKHLPPSTSQRSMASGPAAATYTHLLHSTLWYRNTCVYFTRDNSDFLLLFNKANGQPQNIGALSAYPFAPYMADGLGRCFSIIFGANLIIASTVTQTASSSL
ncbi:uncharacterized protein BJ212DRAFT_1520411 [Suillus subaureus]|uniref:Uncharacterized protein n=1 Tax=Suillus subaureus TaxID=48587 RepID=A0A9P7DIX8_9AGAM|nr:uncharacterized protein BJ212DRAFT_1529517 [Suillus subaureus]XP_041190491.1 uncharacterized protein BJ212DRAFT_1520411 [Suillus subaureus]KAG1794728.1 hypothetical protein BJ212DRAFT_1529517 [Suillus subaureus]KAG1812209.1 hypothetical protein BJ212DRAFT_1520411 [Suillus subaureus]